MKDRTHTLHPVHLLIRALGRDETLQAKMAANRESVFAEFGLSEEEISALGEGTIAALAGLGVHPMYRMHWLMMSNPDSAIYLSVNEYIDKARSGAKDG